MKVGKADTCVMPAHRDSAWGSRCRMHRGRCSRDRPRRSTGYSAVHRHLIREQRVRRTVQIWQAVSTSADQKNHFRINFIVAFLFGPDGFVARLSMKIRSNRLAISVSWLNRLLRSPISSRRSNRNWVLPCSRYLNRPSRSRALLAESHTGPLARRTGGAFICAPFAG